MTEHWWRAYDGSIDHPKLLKLSDAMHRAWYTLQCVASANGGTLPPVSDIAVRLRMKPTKVTQWLEHLVEAGLMDQEGSEFKPHNWDGRQYKMDSKDPTNAQRQRDFRKRQDLLRNEVRNALRNGVTYVSPKRPDTDTDKITTAPPVETRKGSPREIAVSTDLVASIQKRVS